MSIEQSRQYHHGNLAEDILQRAAEVIAEEGIEALSLRSIARDLGVSHGAPNRHFKNKAALLSALTTLAWHEAQQSTIEAADATGSQDPHIRLNAMGRGFLRWALNNKALFKALTHPDVNRFADENLAKAMQTYRRTLFEACGATQADGRHPGVPLPLLSLFTNSVPLGVAISLMNPLGGDQESLDYDEEEMIEQIINLVVPLTDVQKREIA